MKDYSKVRFIKISDNNDPFNFYIDATTMFDPRLRISALKGQYQKYLETDELYRPVYKVLEKDYSFCCVFKGSFDDLDQIKHKRDELYEFYNDKLEGHVHKPQSNIISFD